MEDYLKRLDLNNPDAMYLVKINHKKQSKMSTIVADAPFHKSHATRAIARLTKRHLVEKKADPDDLRGFLVSITPEGEKIAFSVLEGFSAWDKLIKSMLTEKEQEDLQQIYQKISMSLRQYFQEDDPSEKDV
jgi:DNA-binding MarR family transcriptional regulator